MNAFEEWAKTYQDSAGKPLDFRKNKFGTYYSAVTRMVLAAWLHGGPQ